MASTDTWSDFETLRHNVKLNTVDKLKQILTGFNEECSTLFFKSGKKQEIIDRIVAQLDVWRQSNNSEKWIKAKAVLSQVRGSGMYAPNRFSSTYPSSAVPHTSYVATTSNKPVGYPTTPIAGPSTAGRYDPYALPRKTTATTVPFTSSPPNPVIRFKPSPFFRVDQMVSLITECPESASATDRRQQIVNFTLNADQISKLRLSSPTYQLRLFCTSSLFYSPGPCTFNTGPCPIEFPPTCEVRVNNVQLTVNLKGLKKKPGTAPPADLSKGLRLNNVQNRIEMVYVNSQQPVQPKKFYLVVMLVEVTRVDQLVDRLKKGKYKSSNDIKHKMIESLTEDDDIVAGPQKISLKCPLSFMRVNTPCRSSQCVHPQCFDAMAWFSMMEQTTTWLCPVCEKVLNYEDLIIDGYFDEILKQTPDSVEDVMMEADGEWHTADNKYGSANWKASHPPTTIVRPPSTPRKPSANGKSPSQTPSKSGTDGNSKAKANDVEIVVLDSDDEDEGRVKRELSPSFGSGSSVSANQSFEGPSVPQSQTQGEVIDLTADSDEEDPVTRRVEKRKATDEMSPTEQIWKKGRLDGGQLSDPRMNGHVNGAGSSSSAHGTAHLHHSVPAQNNPVNPRSPTSRYLPPFPGSMYPNYTRPPVTRGMPNNPQVLPYLPQMHRWP